MINDAKQIFEAALKSVDARKLTAQTEIETSSYAKIKVFAIGKAAEFMMAGLIDKLGEKISAGLVITKELHGLVLPPSIKAVRGSHPIPDHKSLDAGEKLLTFCKAAEAGELVVGLISGGSSSLVEALSEGFTLTDLQSETSRLLKSGADIHELNSARKKMSLIKGGKLAAAIAPATSINFILSDVIGDDLSVIASGPTVTTDTSLTVRNHLIGSNRLAVEAARLKATELGYETRALPQPVVGEAQAAGEMFANFASQLSDRTLAKPLCVIGGGETVVTVRGEGKGGRNQELALAYLSRSLLDKNLESAVFLSGSTDGDDGPTDAAGAFVNRSVIRNVELSRLSPKDFLDRSDSYRFFEETGGLFKTGPTGTNVCDLQILLIPATK